MLSRPLGAPHLKQCGILLRGYAKKPEAVKDVVGRLHSTALQAMRVGFYRIVILIPAEKDCGLTADATRRKFAFPERNGVSILSPGGNENSHVLNIGVKRLENEGYGFAFIASNKAIGHLTKQNVEKMLVAFGHGAFVSGLAMRDTDHAAVNDETFIGTLSGRIVNTLSAWQISMLSGVGGFDSEIGVEEIAPMLRLCQGFGKGIAPILPANQAGLDVSAFQAAHHEWVASTKWQRQLQEANRVGGSFEQITDGILSGYPQ
ncbi:MAG: hypothetical protein ACHQU0_02160 [Candidatus Paceibacteria bacterium]